jgi:hypothetical protein
MRLENAFDQPLEKKSAWTSLNPGLPLHRIAKNEPTWTDSAPPLQFIQNSQLEEMASQDNSSELVLTFNKHKHPFFKLYSTTARSFITLLPVPFTCLSAPNPSNPNLLSIDIECSSFEKSHLEILIDFYSQSNWNPRVIERPASTTTGPISLAAYNLSPAELGYLLRINDTKQLLPKVYEACCFFKFQAAIHLCYVLVGSHIGYGHASLSLLHKCKKRLRIDGPLDCRSIMMLQRKYPAFCEFGEDPDDEPEDFEEDGEYEDIEEEEEEQDDRGGEEEEQYFDIGPHLHASRGGVAPREGDQVIDLTSAFKDSNGLADNKEIKELMRSMVLNCKPEHISSDVFKKCEGLTPELLYESLGKIGLGLRLDIKGRTLYFKLPGTNSDQTQPEVKVNPK